MGWKGTIRSINASIRESERQQRARDRRRRQKERAEAEYVRFQEQAHEQSIAAHTVNAYEQRLTEIVSYHHICNADMDWHSIREECCPIEPSPVTSRSSVIQNKIDNFKPWITDKILNTEKWRRKRLQRQLQAALEQDEKEYQYRLSQFHKDLENWQSRQIMAARLFDDDSAAFIETIKTYEFFIEHLPCGYIHFNMDQHRNIIAEIGIASLDEIVPSEEHSLTKREKLSSKNMAKTKRAELYQDHIASCVLRIVREIFALVPVEQVIANAYIKAINSQTGHREDQLILSVRINKSNFAQINLKNIDPSDSLKNFPYNMNFKKTKGFSAVLPVNPF